MAQHFLLSARARTLSLREIYQSGEDAVYATFCKLRWPETGGSPQCPRCSGTKAYHLATRRTFKCAACYHQFSVTSGTILPPASVIAYAPLQPAQTLANARRILT